MLSLRLRHFVLGEDFCCVDLREITRFQFNLHLENTQESRTLHAILILNIKEIRNPERRKICLVRSTTEKVFLPPVYSCCKKGTVFS